MTSRIYKYEVPVADEFMLDMPRGAKPLTVQTQGGAPMMWALVNDAMPAESCRYFVVGTGNRMPDDAYHYVGTWQDGPFVWHLWADRMGVDQ